MLKNDLFLSIKHDKFSKLIDIYSPIFLIGSCFSENIAQKLSQRKFNILSNPSGILFDTLSIEKTISDISNRKKYVESDLFYQNELNGSWAHHTDFSFTDISKSIASINQSIEDSHLWLQNTDTVIITLGSAFSYFHKSEQRYVANCHKVPQTEFQKELISIDRIISSLENIREMILSINPACNFILTISPVRHLRDGVVENNRSKARLIEAINQFTILHPDVYYFPSYEIVIDVLRDYRFFDIDFAHPNYLATDIVFDYFKDLCLDPSCIDIMEKFNHLNLAMKHRSRNPDTEAHKRFLETHLEKAKDYQTKYPDLDFSMEINYFNSEIARN